MCTTAHSPVLQASLPTGPAPNAAQPPIATSVHHAATSPATYELKRYYWRSFLTLVGPLLAVGFFVFICVGFLINPPSNDIVEGLDVDARWVFYLWFITVVFTLDWAKTGLANIEAAVLMHPRLAPETAMKLMWHTDNKWSNPLWWLRAIRGELLALYWRRKPTRKDAISRPGLLWYSFSFVMLLLFIALPLSGLAIELNSQVTSRTNTRAMIYGPNRTTFSQRSVIDMPRAIRSRWQSGEPTSPSGGSIVYAPNGTRDVSDLYFDAMASQHSKSIEFFVGPAVREIVSGTAWGVWSNISCMPVYKEELHMIRVDNFTYSLNQLGCSGCGGQLCCDFAGWRNITNLLDDRCEYVGCSGPVRFPQFVNQTSGSGHLTRFSFIAVADGSKITPIQGSPFVRNLSIDYNTYDSVENTLFKDQDRDKASTTAMLEFFLWQSSIRLNDSVLANLTSGRHPDPVDILQQHQISTEFPQDFVDFAGVSMHCEITTVVGFAKLDAAQRTFSNFRDVRAASNQELHHFDGQESMKDVEAPQLMALKALSIDVDAERASSGNSVLGETSEFVGYTLPEYDAVWIALHSAVRSNALPPGKRDWARENAPVIQYPALTPKDVQLALYKLLGESVFQLMAEGGVEPWQGSLFTFKKRTYLVAGAVSWKFVVAILAFWAIMMSSGAIWMILFAGPRWAPSLNGFEMFKFGAQHTDDVNDFLDLDFQGCKSALDRVPGMVGMLPGIRGSGGNLGFIGLSENRASKNATYTWNREQASVVRPY